MWTFYLENIDNGLTLMYYPLEKIDISLGNLLYFTEFQIGGTNLFKLLNSLIGK